jgi:hypothetical protein
VVQRDIKFTTDPRKTWNYPVARGSRAVRIIEIFLTALFINVLDDVIYSLVMLSR